MFEKLKKKKIIFFYFICGKKKNENKIKQFFFFFRKMIPVRFKPSSKSRFKTTKSGLFNSKMTSGELMMGELHEAHDDFIQYLENLDSTIKTVLAHHQTLIKGRYLSASQHLDKVRKNLVAYDEKMQKLKKDLNENESIKNMVLQIANFNSFYLILQEKLSELDLAIQSKEQESNVLFDKMIEKKNLLLQVHQENIRLSTKILSYKKSFPLNKKQIVIVEPVEKNLKTDGSDKQSDINEIKTPALSAQLSLKKIQKDFTALKYETEKVETENHAFKAEISKKANTFFQNKGKFQECLRALSRSLLLSQQVTANHTGLKNSLLFKLDKMPSIKPEISRTLSAFKQHEKKTFLQDREVTNVVYSTLQKVVRDRRMPKRNTFENLDVTWDEFKEFTPMQIMGLLSVKPLIRDNICKEFDEKEKKINIFLNKIKTV